MTGHMGMFEVKGQVYGFIGSPLAVGSDPKSEAVLVNAEDIALPICVEDGPGFLQILRRHHTALG